MSVLPATIGSVQCRRTDIPHVVVHVDRDPRWDNLVDAVEHVVWEFDPVRGEVALQVLDGARPDDGGGDCGMADSKCDGDLHERQAGIVGECTERIGGVELGRVCRAIYVPAPWEALQSSGRTRPT